MWIRVFALDTEGMDFTGKAWRRWLSGERLHKADRLRTEEQRRLFLGAELLLNRSLERIQAPVSLPAAYMRNSHGKPYLTDASGLYVNWSHSGTQVICALSDREVGVDLQDTQKEPKASLVDRVLQPEERFFYERAEAGRQKRLFYEYWVLKESFLKALGTGFCTPLDTFYIRMEGRYPEVVRRDEPGSYTCRLLNSAADGYAAAFCVEGDHCGPEGWTEIEYMEI